MIDSRLAARTIPAKTAEVRKTQEIMMLLRELRSEYAILYNDAGCPVMPLHLKRMMDRIDALVNDYHNEIAEHMSCSR